jgi:hypothetical protein
LKQAKKDRDSAQRRGDRIEQEKDRLQEECIDG